MTSQHTCLPNRPTATAVCVMYRDTSSIVSCGHYLTTAVSLPPQFLLWANIATVPCLEYIQFSSNIYFIYIYQRTILVSIHLSITRSQKCSIPVRFPNQNCICLFFPHICYMPCASHSSYCNHSDSICWRAQVVNLHTEWMKTDWQNISYIGKIVISDMHIYLKRDNIIFPELSF
jgi:hypothetical protein